MLINPLEHGWTPEKIVDALVVKGEKTFVVKFLGARSLGRVSADRMKKEYPKVCIFQFFEK
jgi:hypothetical protein